MKNELADKILEEMGRVVALQLWQLGAIKVNLDKPFRLVSGNYSPIYINCRQLISSPAFVDLFAASARLLCERHGIEFDVIAGGETAGIPFAAFLSRSFGRPLVYARKETKGHGLASRIEGSLAPDQLVLLVEDLITDAGSKMSFVQAIRDTGAQVKEVIVVFDRLQGGREALAKAGIRLHALADLDLALEIASQFALLSAADTGAVHDYLNSPSAWHEERGLQYFR